MPRATLTTGGTAADAPGRVRRPGSGDAVEHSLRLGLGGAARGGENFAQQIARAVLVANALEFLSQLELARERIAAVVEPTRRRVRILGHGDRLVEVERDAGEVERQRLVALVGGRGASLVGDERHLQRR